jgi:aspartate/methionine/tyrosine aminotransferase
MFSRRTDWKLAPNSFAQAQQEFLRSGRELLDLTVSNPTRVGLNFQGAAIRDALASPEVLDYDPQPHGLQKARTAVAGYYGEQKLLPEVLPESLLLTTGTSEGYAYIFRLLCNYEDEILVPKPSYPLFEFLADLQDVRLIPYPLIYDHGWQADFSSLQRIAGPRTRAIVLVHPNNPTGSYISPRERALLNDFCHDRDLALVVDEVFLDYAHDGRPRASFAANQPVLTFTLSGLSKLSCLPQMKASWLVTSGPADKVDAARARLEVIADTYLSMNTPVQAAFPVLLEQRKNMQPLVLDRIKRNLGVLDSELGKQEACERLELEGGWYGILRAPAVQSDDDLAVEILRTTSVLLHPGHFYDISGEGYLVLSLITPEEDFRKGVGRVLTRLNRPDGGFET